MVRICSQCKTEKPVSEFHSTGYYKGKLKYKPDCKRCANEKWRMRYFTKLSKVVGELKCSQCGYDKCPQAIDFHHLDPNEKDFNISSHWTISEERLKQEVKKCIQLCANCHREHHAGIRELN